MRVFVMGLIVVSAAVVEARPLRRYRQNRAVSAAPAEASMPAGNAPAIHREVSQAISNSVIGKSVDDALSEVNAERAKRGLRPFLPDPLLNDAARSCAKLRAARLIEGHLDSDFHYLPAGASAVAAGCGALEPSWGWGTCCTYDNYTYAGAAWVMGRDGKRYMHLFVR